MASKPFDNLLLCDVPVCQDATRSSNCKIVSWVAPGHASDLIWRSKIVQLRHFTGGGVPQIHTWTETNRKRVLRWPIHQVKVIVILQCRGVKNLVRRLLDFPLMLVRNTEHALLFKALEHEVIVETLVVVRILVGKKPLRNFIFLPDRIIESQYLLSRNLHRAQKSRILVNLAVIKSAWANRVGGHQL